MWWVEGGASCSWATTTPIIMFAVVFDGHGSGGGRQVVQNTHSCLSFLASNSSLVALAGSGRSLISGSLMFASPLRGTIIWQHPWCWLAMDGGTLRLHRFILFKIHSVIIHLLRLFAQLWMPVILSSAVDILASTGGSQLVFLYLVSANCPSEQGLHYYLEL